MLREWVSELTREGWGGITPARKSRGTTRRCCNPASDHIQEPCWLGHLQLGLGDRLVVRGVAGRLASPDERGLYRYTEKFEFCPSGAQAATR